MGCGRPGSSQLGSKQLVFDAVPLFLPQGPTLTMRVHEYALMRDVAAAQPRPRAPSSLWAAPPLLVMNNFGEASSGRAAQPLQAEDLLQWAKQISIRDTVSPGTQLLHVR